MDGNPILALKRWREAMPKYYRGKGDECGIQYKVRGVKWRRLRLLRLFPYCETDRIWLHISIKKLPYSEQYQEATLHISPPIKERFYPERADSEIIMSDTFLEFKPPLEDNKWWSTNLLVGYYEFAPYKMKCSLDLKTSQGAICTIPIADIQVVDTWDFWRWNITTGIAVLALVASISAIVLHFI